MATNATIRYHIRITGTMQLVSPLLIGSGDTSDDPTADIHVIKDWKERPFIPGTSITGVLRSFVRKHRADYADLLFGHIEKGHEKGLQSAVSIQDVLLEDAEITIRDGVSIDYYTQIAKNGSKYNYEAVERGATGAFVMEMTLRQYHVDMLPQWQSIVEMITNQLACGIRLGALTAKGFGRVAIGDVTAQVYDMTQAEAVRQWLLQQPGRILCRGERKESLPPGTLVITGNFALKTALLVRNTDVDEDDRLDKIHAVPVTSKGDYVIPGTSVKGVLRHQAAYILRVLQKPERLLDGLMGYATPSKKQKSRFLTDEVYFKNYVEAKKQTRNRIDRFTGSTMDSFLFAEKPLWQQDKHQPALTIRFTITDCKDWEAGLALFLLKDLWTGHVALGGDKAIGRGYLQGLSATVEKYTDAGKDTWKLTGQGKVQEGDAATLESYAAALCDLPRREEA